ncbi:hypothetical protein K439DRAFT_1324302 [Ramaria rubella]|nr:hypothetical protein K439DRAFT_1324302 [Ramaria rubella]
MGNKQPLILTWDSAWWSCAYDSIIVILYNIWKHHNIDFDVHLVRTPYCEVLEM